MDKIDFNVMPPFVFVDLIRFYSGIFFSDLFYAGFYIQISFLNMHQYASRRSSWRFCLFQYFKSHKEI